MASKRFDGQTLRIATYGGTYGKAFDDAFGRPFAEATGAKIEYVAGNPGDFGAKLLASRGADPGFDVADLDDIQVVQVEAQGLIEKIDAANMPRLKGVFPAAMVIEGYTPALTWYRLAFGYNTEKLGGVGMTDPTSWAAFFDPKLANRVAVPAVTVSMALPTLVMANLLAGAPNESNLEPGFNKLSELKVSQVYQSSTAIEPQVISGDVWAYTTTPARIYQLQGQGVPVKLVYPELNGKRGILTRSSAMQIVKGTKVKELAEAFIDWHFDPKAVTALTLATGVEPAVMDTVAELEKDPKFQGKFITPQIAQGLYVPDVKALVAQMPAITERWGRLFLR